MYIREAIIEVLVGFTEALFTSIHEFLIWYLEAAHQCLEDWLFVAQAAARGVCLFAILAATCLLFPLRTYKRYAKKEAA